MCADEVPVLRLPVVGAGSDSLAITAWECTIGESACALTVEAVAQDASTLSFCAWLMLAFSNHVNAKMDPRICALPEDS